MKKNKNELEYLLNLDLLTKLINILKENQNVEEFREDNIEYNLKKYYFAKNGNTLVVESSDGKKMEISITKSIVNYGVGVVKYINSQVKYKLPSDNELIMNKNYSKRMMDYPYLLGHDDINEDVYFNIDFEFGYHTKEDKNYHYLIWNPEENKFNLKYGLIHEDNGYISFNGIEKYLLSNDLNKIISINGKEIPNLEEVKRFNLQEEKNKLINVLNKSELNELSKDLLRDTIINLNEKEKFANQIIDAYENTVIPESKKILELETKINEDTINNIFSKKELLFIIEVIREIIKNKKENLEEKIGKFINNLSLEEIKILKEQLENNNNSNIKNKIE